MNKGNYCAEVVGLLAEGWVFVHPIQTWFYDKK